MATVLRATVAVFGLLEAVFPRRVVDWWMALVTERGQSVELRSWVYTAARVEGVLLLWWALRRGNDGSD